MSPVPSLRALHPVTRRRVAIGSPGRLESQILFEQHLPVVDETSCTAAISSFGIGVFRWAARWRRTIPARSRPGCGCRRGRPPPCRGSAAARRRSAPVAVRARHVDAGAPAVAGHRDAGVDRRRGHLGHLHALRGAVRVPVCRPKSLRADRDHQSDGQQRGGHPTAADVSHRERRRASGPCPARIAAPRDAAAAARALPRRARDVVGVEHGQQRRHSAEFGDGGAAPLARLPDVLRIRGVRLLDSEPST